MRTETVATFGLLASSYLSFLGAKAHLVERTFGSPVDVEELNETLPLHRRGAFDFDYEPDSDNKLLKRGSFNFATQTMEFNEISTFQRGFMDMREIVNYVAQNPNQLVMNRYFDPAHSADVTNIFRTVRDMAGPGVNRLQATATDIGPLNLNEIRVESVKPRKSEDWITLAESFNVEIRTQGQRLMKVYPFGHGGVFQPTISGLKCTGLLTDRTVITKVNFKLYTLGAVFLHEVLHFNSVCNVAWRGPNAQTLLADEVLDDQEGDFLCDFGPLNRHTAYGPYEAVKLLARDHNLARLNIENYVWYALETYWTWKCPNLPREPSGRILGPDERGIPAGCTQFAKGIWASIWCWRHGWK